MPTQVATHTEGFVTLFSDNTFQYNKSWYSASGQEHTRIKGNGTWKRANGTVTLDGTGIRDYEVARQYGDTTNITITDSFPESVFKFL